MRRASALFLLIAIAFGVAALPVGSSTVRAPALPEGVAVDQPANIAPAVAEGWLDRLNSYRSAAGLAPVRENPDWSNGALLHSSYLVRNDRVGHAEDPSLPGYSAEGAAAGAAGNVVSGTIALTEADAIDAWMTAPFHAIGMLDPRLTQSGFGLAVEREPRGISAAATLDVIRGLDWSVPWPTTPVVFPAAGVTVPIGSYAGNEWPDPLSVCGAGWQAPTALPVIAMFPRPVARATATVNGVSASSEVCVVTPGAYGPSPSSSDAVGRDVLDARNAVLVIARHPFGLEQTQSVEIQAVGRDGSTMRAATFFTYSDRSFGSHPVWAELQPGASGHWVVTDTGAVTASGSAAHHGGVGHLRLAEPIVAMQSTRTGDGYWMVARDGGVFSFGDAVFHGSAGGEQLRGVAVAIERTRSGNGYWIVTSAGEVRAYGDAKHHGDLTRYTLAAPVVDIARSPDGRGYWLVASDGGVFTFGAAGFHGSAGAITLAQPVVALEPTITGNGYWLLALDGGVFTYGDAQFHGSAGGVQLDSAVRAMTRSPGGAGYWLLTERGQILGFGDAS